ncbi:Holliday junction branch migration DNA helicase RuvB [Agrobacterium rubi]|nr:Holliday junction branch migration DNA helicase RuvB [Agrobacterium rubi]NTF24210.1 Holliday junction branch migration DNA helicase RuvB [Agrobacterium rubi]
MNDQDDEDIIEGSSPADQGVPRPRSLAEFNGQSAAKENLGIYISSARIRSAPLDHVLFDGPPGVGKTTLAQIMAFELGANFKTVSAPSLKQPSDVFSMLSTLEDRDVLFIDEIHRLPITLEENLYTAMEDFCMDLVVGEPGNSRIVRVPIPPFTLIGATTRRGMLSQPLRDRFGINIRLELYTVDEMKLVIERAAGKLSLSMETAAIASIASRSRGTPRIGLKLLNRVRDHAVADGRDEVTLADACTAMDRIGVDVDGLDENDRRYLSILRDRFKGGPVGLKSLAMALAETEETLENTVEPYLLMKGIIDRTARGRVLRSSGIEKFAQKSFF